MTMLRAPGRDRPVASFLTTRGGRVHYREMDTLVRQATDELPYRDEISLFVIDIFLHLTVKSRSINQVWAETKATVKRKIDIDIGDADAIRPALERMDRYDSRLSTDGETVTLPY